MIMKRTIGMTLGAVTLGWVLLGASDAANHEEPNASRLHLQHPGEGPGRDERGERQGEGSEAARLGEDRPRPGHRRRPGPVPGKVLKAELDDENGHLVYSVERHMKDEDDEHVP